MKRSPRLTQGFTRTLNPKLERFIRVNPTAVELIKRALTGTPKGKWLKRASFIVCAPTLCFGTPPPFMIYNTINITSIGFIVLHFFL